MKPLCVIPSRAGSKRLASKNMLALGRRPMVAWTIEAALESGIFDSVYVSTECEKIAETARQYGAEIPALRPTELAGDTVTNVAVSLHMSDLLAERGQRHDAIMCLQPSSPLRGASHIRGAWEIFEAEGRDFLVSVTEIDPHYFHWALSEDGGDWGMFFGDRFMTVRQNLPDVFRPNGAIKIARTEALRATGNFFGDKLGVFPMPEEASVHVTTAFDLKICETIVRSHD